MEEEESEEEEDELPMYQEHYDALFSMDFVETKYPHDDTMKALGSLRMWSWSQEHALGQVLLLPHGVYKELTFGDLLGSLWEGTMESRKDDSKGFGLQSLMEYSSSRSKAAQIRSPVLEICAQGSCQHLLCKERHWDNQ
ncbi:unnamed protein product [Microthlaspi erraticum]|uniref:Arabidopsis retrotransposon Orf1 C-terminal domain-containing protein n=1 Tax=Microthlaspi erraticum TaxID=1685480 RepID=A0A6D2KCH7_9BRAS|nr:unnamed protein product [Microthlaspi erraticum]